MLDFSEVSITMRSTLTRYVRDEVARITFPADVAALNTVDRAVAFLRSLSEGMLQSDGSISWAGAIVRHGRNNDPARSIRVTPTLSQAQLVQVRRQRDAFIIVAALLGLLSGGKRMQKLGGAKRKADAAAGDDMENSPAANGAGSGSVDYSMGKAPGSFIPPRPRHRSRQAACMEVQYFWWRTQCR